MIAAIMQSRTDGRSQVLRHLIELRMRLLRALAGPAAASLCLLPFSNEVYQLVARPLLQNLPQGSAMVATDITSPFMTPVRLAMFVSFAVSAPWVLYQIWAFVAPGLYNREKRLIAPLVISSAALFYGGMAFAYAAVLPIALKFFIETAPSGVFMMADIRSYLDFVFAMFFAFGVAFEVPVAVVLLSRAGLVDPAELGQNRPYVLLAISIVSAILTPPDVFSQLMLAVPMYALFELGLLAAPKWRMS